MLMQLHACVSEYYSVHCKEGVRICLSCMYAIATAAYVHTCSLFWTNRYKNTYALLTVLSSLTSEFKHKLLIFILQYTLIIVIVMV